VQNFYNWPLYHKPDWLIDWFYFSSIDHTDVEIVIISLNNLSSIDITTIYNTDKGDIQNVQNHLSSNTPSHLRRRNELKPFRSIWCKHHFSSYRQTAGNCILTVNMLKDLNISSCNWCLNSLMLLCFFLSVWYQSQICTKKKWRSSDLSWKESKVNHKVWRKNTIHR
jgi:hypothetical protein